jgi:hypothetical protein
MELARKPREEDFAEDVSLGRVDVAAADWPLLLPCRVFFAVCASAARKRAEPPDSVGSVS